MGLLPQRGSIPAGPPEELVTVAPAGLCRWKYGGGMELARRLGIRSGARLAIVDPPGRFREELIPLPDGVEEVTLEEGDLDCIVLFTRDRGELASSLPTAVRAMNAGCSLWLAWPKQLSGYTSDLTAEVIQAAGMRYGLLSARRLALGDAWTGMRFIVRMDDRKAWAKRSFDE